MSWEKAARRPRGARPNQVLVALHLPLVMTQSVVMDEERSYASMKHTRFFFGCPGLSMQKLGYNLGSCRTGALASRSKAADRMRAVHWTLPEQK